MLSKYEIYTRDLCDLTFNAADMYIFVDGCITLVLLRACSMLSSVISTGSKASGT